jgi:hypothetical protein
LGIPSRKRSSLKEGISKTADSTPMKFRVSPGHPK